MLKSRDGYPGPIGLDKSVSRAALSIPSSFPNSQVLKSIQGDLSMVMMQPYNG